MIKSTKKSEIERNWYLIDAKGQIVGRLASKITGLLMGKGKPYFVKNMDCGDHVVVINAKEVVFTGKKEKEKNYYSYSGYPGGLSKKTVAQVRESAPERIIENAVNNMLPKNRLRRLWQNKLHVFAGEKHSYEDKFKTKEEKHAKNK